MSFIHSLKLKAYFVSISLVLVVFVNSFLLFLFVLHWKKKVDAVFGEDVETKHRSTYTCVYMYISNKSKNFQLYAECGMHVFREGARTLLPGAFDRCLIKYIRVSVMKITWKPRPRILGTALEGGWEKKGVMDGGQLVYTHTRWICKRRYKNAMKWIKQTLLTSNFSISPPPTQLFYRKQRFPPKQSSPFDQSDRIISPRKKGYLSSLRSRILYFL